MNKEEILAKSRNENKDGDERDIQILANASKVGMSVGGILSFALVVFSRITDELTLGLSAWTVYFLMFGSRRLYQFIKTKEKVRLLQSIVGVVFGLACLVAMVYLVLKK